MCSASIRTKKKGGGKEDSNRNFLMYLLLSVENDDYFGSFHFLSVSHSHIHCVVVRLDCRGCLPSCGNKGLGIFNISENFPWHPTGVILINRSPGIKGCQILL